MLDRDLVSVCAQYVLEKTRFVIEEYGPRPAGSPGEGHCQQFIKRELEECCDGDVTMKPFPVAQKAFMGMQRVAGIILLAAFALYWVHPFLAAACSTVALVIMVQQLLRYKLFLDPFFRKYTSYNVAGRQAPSGEVKRRIILNAHPDAAYEWRWLYHFPKAFPFFTLFSLAGLPVKVITDYAFLFLGGSWAAANNPGVWMIVGLVQLLVLPGTVIAIGWVNFKVVSPGANDNLSGSFIAAGIAKCMRESGMHLENTELMVCITGSEEAGLRGAKVFAREHRKELRDVETVVIALDTFRDIEHLTIYTRDLNGTVAHDPAVARLVEDAGKNLGLDLPRGSVFLGSTDASAFTQEGYRAVALAAMDPAPADFYHTRRDHHSNMDRACLERTIAVVCEAIKLYDERGLGEG